MDGFDPATSFGPDVASRYDDELRGDEAETVDLLAGLAGTGRALELAIGTGRIAVPLAERGVTRRRHRALPRHGRPAAHQARGRGLEVWPGDMSRVETGRRYRLVYLVFNTLFNLLTQDDQVRCFRNAARHLTDDGVFVVEAGVPSAWTTEHDYVRPERVGLDSVTLDVCHYDPVTQILEENHVSLTASGIRFGPIVCRLVWPTEMDLMARLAGLRLRDRWAGWCDEPFTAASERHVSVYQKDSVSSS